MKKDLILRIVVVGVGVTMFVLLLFADKTNLDNDKSGMVVQSTESVTENGALSSANLPPLAPDARLDGWVEALNDKKGAERLALFDSIVVNLQARNRLAYAAQYAQQKADESRSLEDRLNAGRISYLATRLEYVSSDSVLFRQFSDGAIQQLRQVNEAEPDNEEALLYLGLALTESGKPENSMQGIMTIRRVLEINPDNVDASFLLGRFSMQTGQYAKAISRYEKVLEIQPENEAAKLNLASALIANNERSKAEKLLSQLENQSRDPEVQAQARQMLNEIQ